MQKFFAEHQFLHGSNKEKRDFASAEYYICKKENKFVKNQTCFDYRCSQQEMGLKFQNSNHYLY